MDSGYNKQSWEKLHALLHALHVSFFYNKDVSTLKFKNIIIMSLGPIFSSKYICVDILNFCSALFLREHKCNYAD